MTGNTDDPDKTGSEGGDEHLREAVRAFLADVDRTYDEYDQGYADADATLRMLRSHVETLREEFDGGTRGEPSDPKRHAREDCGG